MSDDHKAVTEGNENRNREQDGSHLSISIQQEWEYYETGKNVPKAFDPHEGKTRWVVNRNSIGRRRAGRIKYEVDADTDYSNRNDEGKPKESRGSIKFGFIKEQVKSIETPHLTDSVYLFVAGNFKSTFLESSCGGRTIVLEQTTR